MRGSLALWDFFHRKPKILYRGTLVGAPAAPPRFPLEAFELQAESPTPVSMARPRALAPSRPAVYFLPRAMTPLLWEKIFIKSPPKMPIRETLVGAPAVPSALPSRNFLITDRTFYARIYGSRPDDALHNPYHVGWRPCPGKTFSSQAHPKSSTGRLWSARPPSHPQFPLPTFLLQAELSMPVSIVRALTTRCIISTMWDGALALGKLFLHRPFPKSSTGRLWSARPPCHPRLPLETL